MFGDERLQEDRGLRGVETRGEIVDGDLQGVFGDGAGVGVIAGEGVPVGDEVEAIVGRITCRQSGSAGEPNFVARRNSGRCGGVLWGACRRGRGWLL